MSGGEALVPTPRKSLPERLELLAMCDVDAAKSRPVAEAHAIPRTALYHSARTRRPMSLPLTPDHPLYGGWQP